MDMEANKGRSKIRVMLGSTCAYVRAVWNTMIMGVRSTLISQYQFSINLKKNEDKIKKYCWVPLECVCR